MNEKQIIKGNYQVGETTEKDVEITYDNDSGKEENNIKLLKFLNSPWQLVKNGAKYGVNGAKRFFTVLFLFGACNTFLFFYATIRLFSSGFTFTKLLYTLLVLVIGITLTAFATYRTYQYVIIDTVRVIYENLASLLKKLTDLLVDKAAAISGGKVNLSAQQLSKAVDMGTLVHETYSGLPRFLRKGIELIFSKIPLVGMLADLKDDITAGNKATASTKLYNKMDGFITESVFCNNNTKWVWWLLPLNIIGLFLLVKFTIG
ncbi:hypothetical protein [Tenacibaculum maritimum]|uniref:hypothetical protein n=1 Tax=Tenacibaculum maritimum TaxID=107401 RepID=UPI003876D2BB